MDGWIIDLMTLTLRRLKEPKHVWPEAPPPHSPAGSFNALLLFFSFFTLYQFSDLQISIHWEAAVMALYLSVSLSVLFPSQHEGNDIIIEFHFFQNKLWSLMGSARSWENKRWTANRAAGEWLPSDLYSRWKHQRLRNWGDRAGKSPIIQNSLLACAAQMDVFCCNLLRCVQGAGAAATPSAVCESNVSKVSKPKFNHFPNKDRCRIQQRAKEIPRAVGEYCRWPPEGAG